MARRSGVGEGGGGEHDLEFGDHVVEFLRPLLRVFLVLGQEHRDGHEHVLGQFDRVAFAVFDQVAVVQRADAQVVELEVAVGIDVGV